MLCLIIIFGHAMFYYIIYLIIDPQNLTDVDILIIQI